MLHLMQILTRSVDGYDVWRPSSTWSLSNVGPTFQSVKIQAVKHTLHADGSARPKGI